METELGSSPLRRAMAWACWVCLRDCVEEQSGRREEWLWVVDERSVHCTMVAAAVVVRERDGFWV